MTDTAVAGPWVRRFLLEHLVEERNLARNTQRSYRDTLALLFPFAAATVGTSVDRLRIVQFTPELIRGFLQHLEEKRGCQIATRNQRLAALHAWAHFVGQRSPEHISWCAEIRSIPFKRYSQALVPYLDKAEMDALLDAPDAGTQQGQRDHVLLLFLYNSGARVEEAAQLTIADLELPSPASTTPPAVKICGKRSKVRRCPLWTRTVTELAPLLAGRAPAERVFRNRLGHPFTRFGMYKMIVRYVRELSENVPSLAHKRVSPHTIRHTTATHLLQAGVDINTIRGWLGHVSLDTTHIYAEVDLAAKARALARCEVAPALATTPWRENTDLMSFLRSL
jgi:site-specific recombinase XerD